MMTAVPNATVVIMNPTHYAVALSYEEGEASAPTCVAKGVDSLALRIRAVAEEAGVPVVEDAPLARALYASVEVVAQYEAVAKVIGFVLAGRRRFSAAR
jgi:flagellar biosynthetic protein FlhB